MSTLEDASAARPPALRLSALLALICLALIVVSVVMTLLILVLLPEVATERLSLPAADAAADPAFTVAQRVSIVVTGLVPLAFVIYALLRARDCFSRFSRGEFFTAEVVGSLRGFAAGIALWILTGWLSTPVLSLLLTLGEEEKTLSIGFSLSGAMTLLFAAIVWQIAHIMRRAMEIADENAQFI